MLPDHMRCREENFIVFMYVLRSIVTPWSGPPNSRDQNHVYVALVCLIHRWPMLERMRKTVCTWQFWSPQRLSVLVSLRMRKPGSCKAQILERCVNFLEIRSELFQKQMR